MEIANWAICNEYNVVQECIVYDILDPNLPSPVTTPGWGLYKINGEIPDIGDIWTGSEFIKP